MTDAAPQPQDPSRLALPRAPGRRGRIRSVAASRAWRGVRWIGYVVVTLVVLAYAALPELEPAAPVYFPRRIWCGRSRADPKVFDAIRTLQWETLAAIGPLGTSTVWTSKPPGDPDHPALVELDFYPDGSASVRAGLLRALRFWGRVPRHASRSYLGTGELLVRDGQTWDSFELESSDDIDGPATPK
jgi:hypothetical protein